jgi:hypothetical protein
MSEKRQRHQQRRQRRKAQRSNGTSRERREARDIADRLARIAEIAAQDVLEAGDALVAEQYASYLIGTMYGGRCRATTWRPSSCRASSPRSRTWASRERSPRCVRSAP